MYVSEMEDISKRACLCNYGRFLFVLVRLSRIMYLKQLRSLQITLKITKMIKDNTFRMAQIITD